MPAGAAEAAGHHCARWYWHRLSCAVRILCSSLGPPDEVQQGRHVLVEAGAQRRGLPLRPRLQPGTRDTRQRHSSATQTGDHHSAPAVQRSTHSLPCLLPATTPAPCKASPTALPPSALPPSAAQRAAPAARMPPRAASPARCPKHTRCPRATPWRGRHSPGSPAQTWPSCGGSSGCGRRWPGSAPCCRPAPAGGRGQQRQGQGQGAGVTWVGGQAGG